MIRLIFSDMDGTLLDENGRLPKNPRCAESGLGCGDGLSHGVDSASLVGRVGARVVPMGMVR